MCVCVHSHISLSSSATQKIIYFGRTCVLCISSLLFLFRVLYAVGVFQGAAAGGCLWRPSRDPPAWMPHDDGDIDGGGMMVVRENPLAANVVRGMHAKKIRAVFFFVACFSFLMKKLWCCVLCERSLLCALHLHACLKKFFFAVLAASLFAVCFSHTDLEEI